MIKGRDYNVLGADEITIVEMLRKAFDKGYSQCKEQVREIDKKLLDNAYQQGYLDGQEIVEDEDKRILAEDLNLAYKRGLSAAWYCATAIELMSNSDLVDVFGISEKSDIFVSYENNVEDVILKVCKRDTTKSSKCESIEDKIHELKSIYSQEEIVGFLNLLWALSRKDK